VQEHSIKLDPSNIASAIIDALKVAVILLVAAWALARVLPSNKALQRTEEK